MWVQNLKRLSTRRDLIAFRSRNITRGLYRVCLCGEASGARQTPGALRRFCRGGEHAGTPQEIEAQALVASLLRLG